MKTLFSKTDWVNNRNKALLRAGEGIIAARRSLDQLDEALQNTTESSPRSPLLWMSCTASAVRSIPSSSDSSSLQLPRVSATRIFIEEKRNETQRHRDQRRNLFG